MSTDNLLAKKSTCNNPVAHLVADSNIRRNPADRETIILFF